MCLVSCVLSLESCSLQLEAWRLCLVIRSNSMHHRFRPYFACSDDTAGRDILFDDGAVPDTRLRPDVDIQVNRDSHPDQGALPDRGPPGKKEIGRAACRERGEM